VIKRNPSHLIDFRQRRSRDFHNHLGRKLGAEAYTEFLKNRGARAACQTQEGQGSHLLVVDLVAS
jgi:hypothetical protein